MQAARAGQILAEFWRIVALEFACCSIRSEMTIGVGMSSERYEAPLWLSGRDNVL
jgi:hypothetical protein